MRKIVLAIGLLFVSSVSAQLDIVRSGNTGFRCVEVVNGQDIVVSGHAQEYKAIASCQRKQLKSPDKTFNVIAKSRLRFQFSSALAQSYPGDGDASVPPDAPDPPNNAPQWLTTPSINFQAGIASSDSFAGDVFDQDSDPLTITVKGGSCTLPTGVSLDSPNKEFDATSGTSAGTTTGCILTADDGEATTDSSAFPITISDPSGLCWPDNGTPSYLPYPANRNGTAGSCPVAEAISYAKNWGGYQNWPTTDPTIIHVTNRNDSGAGSLRACIEASGERVCVFDVGGTINLSSQINIANGNLTVNGHAAPGPVWVVLADNAMVNGVFNVQGDNVIIEGLIFDITTPIACNNSRVFNTGPTADNFKAVNIIGLGATDEQVSWGRGNNLVFVDSIFSNPGGISTCNHHFNFLAQEGDYEVTFLGTNFFQGKNRNPRVLAYNGTYFGGWIYNPGNQAMDISVDAGETGSFTYTWNLAGLYYDEGPNDSASQVIQLHNSGGSGTFSNASEFYITDLRIDSGPCSDAWDAGCVSVLTNSEANIRHNLTDNVPTGLNWSDTSGLSRADFITLNSQNNGAWPNNRSSTIADMYDDAAAGTLQWSAEHYSYTRNANTSGTYSVPASPHADADVNGYPDLMDQFEAERGSMYAN